MKKILFSLAVLGVAACAHAANYRLDSSHSNARFAIDHFGTSTNTGGFYNLEGELTFDPEQQTGAIDLVIPIKNLETANTHFNEHLKGKDLFNEEQYPEMRFQSTDWQFDGKKVMAVAGHLTLLGQTRPVLLHATKFNCYFSPILRRRVCGGDFEATIDRTQWGMNYLVWTGFAKEVKLNIQVEAVKQ